MKNWPEEKQKSGFVIGDLLGFSCFNCGKYSEGKKNEYYKIQHDRFWSLSKNGKIAMLVILSEQDLYDFLEKQTDIKEFDLINSLIRSEKKNLSDRLIGILKKNIDVDTNLIKYLQSWYDEIKPELFSMKINKKRNPDLAQFIEKNYFELQMSCANEGTKRLR